MQFVIADIGKQDPFCCSWKWFWKSQISHLAKWEHFRQPEEHCWAFGLSAGEGLVEGVWREVSLGLMVVVGLMVAGSVSAEELMLIVASFFDWLFNEIS